VRDHLATVAPPRWAIEGRTPAGGAPASREQAAPVGRHRAVPRARHGAPEAITQGGASVAVMLAAKPAAR